MTILKTGIPPIGNSQCKPGGDPAGSSGPRVQQDHEDAIRSHSDEADWVLQALRLQTNLLPRDKALLLFSEEKLLGMKSQGEGQKGRRSK